MSSPSTEEPEEVRHLTCHECGEILEGDELFDHLEINHGIGIVMDGENPIPDDLFLVSGFEDDLDKYPPKSLDGAANRNIDAALVLLFANSDPLKKGTSKLKQLMDYFQIGDLPEFSLKIRERHSHYKDLLVKRMVASPVYCLCIQEWWDPENKKKFLNILCRFVDENHSMSVTSIGFVPVAKDLKPLVAGINAVLDSWMILNAKVIVVTTGQDVVATLALKQIFGGRVSFNVASALNGIFMEQFQKPGYASEMIKILDPTIGKKRMLVEDLIKLIRRQLQLGKGKSLNYNTLAFNDDLLEILTVFAPIIDLMSEISSQGCLQTSAVIPLMKCLVAGLKNTQPLAKWSIAMRDQVLAELGDWYPSVRKHHILPMLLDPRFKTDFGDENEQVAKNLLAAKVHHLECKGIWKHHSTKTHNKLVDGYLATDVIARHKAPLEYFAKKHRGLRSLAERELISAGIYPPFLYFDSTEEPFPGYSIEMHLFFASVRKLIIAEEALGSLLVGFSPLSTL